MDDTDVMNCQEFVELVTDYLEGALSPADQARFEAHLGYCDPCIVYIEEMRLTIGAVGRLSERDLAPAARDQLLAAFRDWKRTA